MKNLITNSLLVVILLSSSFATLSAQTDSHFNHSVFDRLLKKHVNESGKIDYASFMKDDHKLLRQYLSSLSLNPPDTITWSREEQIAYWVNLYNAFTTELILDYYPLNSIKDIGTEIPIAFGESAWDIDFIHVLDKTYTLDAIEKEILRKFNDPRIHFTLVCAAASCPNLRREAYTRDKLESQFNSQAVLFLNNPMKNKLGSEVIEISEIFNWYADEYLAKGSLVDYLNSYATLTINQNASIEFIPFDWSLNGQGK